MEQNKGATMVKLLYKDLQAKFPDCVYQVIEAEEKKNYYSWNGKRFSKRTGWIKIKGQGHKYDRGTRQSEQVGIIMKDTGKYYYVPMIAFNAIFTVEEPNTIIICPHSSPKDMEAWFNEKFSE